MVRPLVADDWRLLEESDKPPYRVQGIAGEIDGRLVGIGGLGFTKTGVLVWTRLTEEARQHPVALHRAATRFLNAAKRHHKMLFAFEQEDVPAAAKWLTRLGFEFVTEHEGERVWLWRS